MRFNWDTNNLYLDLDWLINVRFSFQTKKNVPIFKKFEFDTNWKRFMCFTEINFFNHSIWGINMPKMTFTKGNKPQ